MNQTYVTYESMVSRVCISEITSRLNIYYVLRYILYLLLSLSPARAVT